MARKPSKNLTERELEIMQVLWLLGEAPLGDVQEALNRRGEPVAPSTVATQLNILIQKGFVVPAGRPGRSLYTPAWSKEEATKNLLDDFLARVGLEQSPGFLIQLLKAEKLSEEDRAALQEILREQPLTPTPLPDGGERGRGEGPRRPHSRSKDPLPAPPGRGQSEGKKETAS